MDGMAEASQALVVLSYGIKHYDVEIMNKAAEHTVGIPPQKVYAALPANAFLAWVRSSAVI
jgi:hypothetical protein